MKINSHFLELKDSYLFSTIARRVAAYQDARPEAQILRLGIGDVTLPLPAAAVAAMEAASAELGRAETFRGYGDEQGYGFLREAVAGYYAGRGVAVDAGDIFIGDGAKSDLGNILDILSQDNLVLIPDPVYPVYVDTNIMDGRRVAFLNAKRCNGFLPLPDESIDADVIYLCSPNNPTGAAYDRAGLTAWVNYALSRQTLILFDAAYEAFVRDPGCPRSIFEIDGARRCAIEFCSLSKTAGFTGTRCGYTVIPSELAFDGVPLHRLWLRRQTTKFNGVSYVVQRGAAAVFSPEGLSQARDNIAYYMENAKIMREALTAADIWHVGGENSPYIWLQCPKGLDSWAYFDQLLEKANVVGTPGTGFGKNGEGFFRLTAFNTHENTKKAMERLVSL